jgi:hypothetical protein
MEQIVKLCESIESNIDSYKKINMISELHELISTEEIELNKLLDNVNNIKTDFKIPNKYKKSTIEELEELLNNTNDIEEKIVIYNTINVKINTITNQLFE